MTEQLGDRQASVWVARKDALSTLPGPRFDDVASIREDEDLLTLVHGDGVTRTWLRRDVIHYEAGAEVEVHYNA